LLIEKEHDKLQFDPPWGIEAWPMYDDTIFEWIAKIQGLRGTPWEGGIFKIYIKFDEHFNIRPPKVCFQTIPFHPNVEVSTGCPCVDFLDDFSQWREGYCLSMILVALQTLLSNPVLRHAVNPEAAGMLRHSPQAYYSMVAQCVMASQRVEAGGSPHPRDPRDPDTSKVTFDQLPASAPRPPPRTAPTRGVGKVSKLSFDDYHRTWSGIATSKTEAKAANPLLEAIKDSPRLQQVHLGLPLQEVEDQMRRQMEDHNTLMYGRFKGKQSVQSVKEAKLEQLRKMKKIYFAPRQSPLPPPNQDIHLTSALPALQGQGDDREPWEKEADDLVTWTNNLDSSAIDAT